MNKKSIIILSSLLICFLILLTCGLTFTTVTPSEERVSDKYIKAGYSETHLDLVNYSLRMFTNKDGKYVLIIWYKNKEEAEKSIVTANKAKGDKFAVKRGNAVAIGYEEDIKIFQFA